MLWRMDWRARGPKALDRREGAEQVRPLAGGLPELEWRRREPATRDEIAMLEAGLLVCN